MQEARSARAQVRRLEMQGISWYNQLGEIADDLVKPQILPSLRAHAARLREIAEEMENVTNEQQ